MGASSLDRDDGTHLECINLEPKSSKQNVKLTESSDIFSELLKSRSRVSVPAYSLLLLMLKSTDVLDWPSSEISRTDSCSFNNNITSWFSKLLEVIFNIAFPFWVTLLILILAVIF
jgi:hypothetical protein